MKIAVLVSGGVDSSVALALLKEQGHDVTAFYLKIWLEDELSYLGDCPWEEDLSYARAVCDQLQVPLEIISFQKEYSEIVVAYTLSEVKAGRTPNPDVLCNQYIKFGAFYKAISDEYEYVATGHYAQVEHTPEMSYLKQAVDQVKDQTYFLSNISQAQLKRALFPIGHLPKPQVRALAEKFNLPTSIRKDSQGICFLGKFKFKDFLQAHLGIKAGNIVEFETGQIVGKHEGFWYYTIGQRQGIKLSGGPWYVVAKDSEKNIVFISRNYQEVQESKKGMITSGFNLISGNRHNQELEVRFRHGPVLHQAHIDLLENGNVKIVLHQEATQGIAQGQFAVLYEKNICLGGGVIEQAL